MHFITEPLDIRLISSSFRSSFFATICLFVVIDYWLSAAKLHNSPDTTKLFSTFLLKNLPSDISLHIKIRSSSLNLYFGVLLRQTIREAWADYTKGARRSAYRSSAFCLSLMPFELIARGPSVYRSWPACLSLVGRLLIPRDLLAYASFGSGPKTSFFSWNIWIRLKNVVPLHAVWKGF